MEVYDIDLALAYVWLVAGCLAVGVTILLAVVLTRVPSRRDYLHVYVASLLAARILFCAVVLLTAAIVTLQRGGWHIIPCQVTFWGWTTAWLVDFLTVLTASVCGFYHLRKESKNKRTHTDVTVALVWVFSTVTASCLILVRDEIDSKMSPVYSSHCWTLPYTHQHLFGFGFILIYLVASILITILVSILGVCILPVRHKTETVTQPEGPLLTRYCSDGKKHVTFSDVTSYTGSNGLQGSNNIGYADTERSLSGTNTGPNCTDPNGKSKANGLWNEHKDLTSTNNGIEVIPNNAAKPPSIDRLDRVNILCVISSLSVFLNLIPQTVVLGISLLRDVPVLHGEDILLACGLLHSLLLPVGLCLASRPYRHILSQIITSQSKPLEANQEPQTTDTEVPNISAAGESSTDDYVTIDNVPAMVHRPSEEVTPKTALLGRRPNRSASSVSLWSRDRDIQRRRLMTVRRSNSNQTTREWLQNLRNSMIDRVEDRVQITQPIGPIRKTLTQQQSTTSEASGVEMQFDEDDINNVLDTLDEEDEVYIAGSDADTVHIENDYCGGLNNETDFHEHDTAEGLYCRLEDIGSVVQNRAPFHVSEKYCIKDDTRNERLQYIVHGLEEAGVPFVIDHLGMVHVFDNPDSLPKSLETLEVHQSEVPESTPQDEALYVDIYARATNPFNTAWQPMYADPPSPVEDAEIVAITYTGKPPAQKKESPKEPKKSKNPFLSTSFLQKFSKKDKNLDEPHGQWQSNNAFQSTDEIWKSNNEINHQFHSLGYHGSHVTYNNPFMTSSPISHDAPYPMTNNPFMHDSEFARRNNPFYNDSSSNTSQTSSLRSSSSSSSHQKRKRGFFSRSFSIMEFLRSKSEDLAISDEGKRNSRGGFESPPPYQHSNPFTIHNASHRYTTEYV